MKRLPAITVVVPTKDRPEMLNRSVAAILTQDYEGAFACIVVNDGDKPLAFDFSDPRIHCLQNTRTPGLSGARNTGLLEADTDILAFCDDDDEWYPQKLSMQVSAMATRDAEVVCSGMDICYKGNIRRRVAPLSVSLEQLIRHRTPEFNLSNLVVTRTMMEQVGPFDEELRASADYDWFIRAARHTDIASVQEPLVRIHWGNHSQFAESWEPKIHALDRLIEKHPELGNDKQARAQLLAKRSFALAGAGLHHEARAALRASVRLRWNTRWNVLAALACAGLSPRRIRLMLHRFGRGI